MGKASQAKGRHAETELAGILRQAGYPAVRTGQPLNFGAEPDISGLPGIHVECKRAEQTRLTEWLEQATADAAKFKDGIPAVFHRRNREGWRVTLTLEDFLRLLKGGNVP